MVRVHGFDLVHGAPSAFLRFVVPLPDAAGDDYRRSPLQRFTGVFCLLPAPIAGKEKTVAVSPLLGLRVPDSGVEATRNVSTAWPAR